MRWIECSHTVEFHCILTEIDRKIDRNWYIQGGLATAFDLAAFRLSMIAPVKKSVNHSRTVASMRETRLNKQQHQEVRLRSDSTVWSEFAFGPVGHCFLRCNRFFFRSNVELTFSFLVLRLSLHAVYYAKNETSEQSLYMYMFLDARPFGSLQAFKLCFCLEDSQD